MFDGQYVLGNFAIMEGPLVLATDSALLEHEGIHYYFLHDDHKHTLVLADGDSVHPGVVEKGKLRYHPEESELVRQSPEWMAIKQKQFSKFL